MRPAPCVVQPKSLSETAPERVQRRTRSVDRTDGASHHATKAVREELGHHRARIAGPTLDGNLMLGPSHEALVGLGGSSGRSNIRPLTTVLNALRHARHSADSLTLSYRLGNERHGTSHEGLTEDVTSER